MNVRKVLVCIEQMHGECMIILKVGINLFFNVNFCADVLKEKRMKL